MTPVTHYMFAFTFSSMSMHRLMELLAWLRLMILFRSSSLTRSPYREMKEHSDPLVMMSSRYASRRDFQADQHLKTVKHMTSSLSKNQKFTSEKLKSEHSKLLIDIDDRPHWFTCHLFSLSHITGTIKFVCLMTRDVFY